MLRYTADPLQGCPEICGSGRGADFALRIDCGSVAGLPINLQIWTRGRLCAEDSRDLRSFEIRFDFESNFRFGIRFIVMIQFEIFESSTPSIVLCKETIGGG